MKLMDERGKERGDRNRDKKIMDREHETKERGIIFAYNKTENN